MALFIPEEWNQKDSVDLSEYATKSSLLNYASAEGGIDAVSKKKNVAK